MVLVEVVVTVVEMWGVDCVFVAVIIVGVDVTVVVTVEMRGVDCVFVLVIIVGVDVTVEVTVEMRGVDCVFALVIAVKVDVMVTVNGAVPVTEDCELDVDALDVVAFVDTVDDNEVKIDEDIVLRAVDCEL